MPAMTSLGSPDDLKKSLGLHQLQMTNVPYRTDLIQKLSTFIGELPENGNHFFHLHPDYAVASYQLFLDTNGIPFAEIECLRAKICYDIDFCVSCCKSHYESKFKFLSQYKSIYSDKELDNLKRKLESWTIGRQLKALNDFTSRLLSITTTPELKQFRKETLYIVFEILNYPDTLKEPEVESLFTQLLVKIQQSSKIVFKGEVYPGIILLTSHKDEFLRDWAHNILKSGDSNVILPSLVDLSRLVQSISMYLEYLGSGSSTKPEFATGFQFSSHQEHLWASLLAILSVVKLDQVGILLTKVSSYTDKWFAQLVKTSNEDITKLGKFYAQFLVILLHFTDCSYFKSTEFTAQDRQAVFERVVSESLLAFLSQSKTLSVTADLQRQYEFCFRWISEIATLTPTSQNMDFLDEPLLRLMNNSSKWADICVSFLVEQILLLLQAHSSRLSMRIRDRIFPFLLQLPSTPPKALEFARDTLDSFCSSSELMMRLSSRKRIFPYRRSLLVLASGPLKDDSAFSLKVLSSLKHSLLTPRYPIETEASGANYWSEFAAMLSSWSEMTSFPIADILKSSELILYLACANDKSVAQNMMKRILAGFGSVESNEDMLQRLIECVRTEDLLKHLPTLMASLKDLASRQKDISISAQQVLRILVLVRERIFQRDSLPPATLNYWIHSFLFCLSIVSLFSHNIQESDVSTELMPENLELALSCIRNYAEYRGKLLVFISTPGNFNKDWYQEILGRLLDSFFRIKAGPIAKHILDEILFHLKSSSMVAVTFEKSIISYVEKLTHSGQLTTEQRELVNVWLAGQADDAPSSKSLVDRFKQSDRAVGRPGSISPGSFNSEPRQIDSHSSRPSSAPQLSSRSSTANMIRVERKAATSKPRLLDSMKSEARIDTRKQDLTHRRRPNVPIGGVPLNNQVPGFSSLGSVLAPGLTLMEGMLDDDGDDRRNRERRSIRTIDLPNMDNRRLDRLSRMSSDQSKAKTFLVDIQNLFKSVLSWNMGGSGDFPPDMNRSILRRVPDVFPDLTSYAETFEPLMRMETWQQFVQAQEELRHEDSIKLELEQCIKVDDFHDISFRGRYLDVRVQQWTENMVLCLTGFDRRKKRLRILANVQSLQRQADDMIIVCRCLLTPARSQFAAAFVPRSDWEGLFIFSLVTVLREYEALKSLPDLILCSSVLKPERQLAASRHVGSGGEVSRMQRILQVNEPQARAIHAAVNSRTGFVLIQGPPGTGKTKTILGLVGALLKTGVPIGIPLGTADQGDNNTVVSTTSFKPKDGRKQINRNGILVLAPSNAAIDEIARRLKNGIRNMQGQIVYPKLVRIGSSSVHGSVKDITLDELVEAELAQDSSFRDMGSNIDETDTAREELFKTLKAAKSERDLLHESLNQPDVSAAEISSLKEEIANLSKKINGLRKQIEEEKDKKNTITRDKEKLRREIRTRLLTQADVILSTLSGAGHETLVELKNSVEFPTVIIDEACQAVELSCLIPLKYSVKKCILVGDPNQLPPTVISQAAQEYSYEQSLFQRLMKTIPESVQLLSIQYRMHPDIVSFPSQYFYDGRLQDAPGIILGEAEWHGHKYFPPYKFYDVHQGKEAQGSKRSYENREEAILCTKIVRLLATEFPNIQFGGRIGVITFYKGQVNRLKKEFRSEFGNNILESIDINTVDGFQGQEKDIILLSCVRASPHKGVGFLSDIRRMNVALTRSRCSLLILGNAGALKSNKFWKALLDDASCRRLIQDLTYRDFGSMGRNTLSNLVLLPTPLSPNQKRSSGQPNENGNKRRKQSLNGS